MTLFSEVIINISIWILMLVLFSKTTCIIIGNETMVRDIPKSPPITNNGNMSGVMNNNNFLA